MKSIKPGRGPSKQSFVGAVFFVVFGILWTILAAGISSGMGLIGLIFPLFGICFVGMGIYNAYVAYQNAHGEDRMSLYDIVDSKDEPDPWSPDYEKQKEQQEGTTVTINSNEANFCPYCGKPIEADYKFCKYCGKALR